MQFALKRGMKAEMPDMDIARNLDIEKPRSRSNSHNEILTKDIAGALLDVIRDLKSTLEDSRKSLSHSAGAGCRCSTTGTTLSTLDEYSTSGPRSSDMMGIPPEIMSYVRTFGHEPATASDLMDWLTEFEDTMEILGLDGQNGTLDKRSVVARLALKGKARKVVLAKRAWLARQGQQLSWAEVQKSLRLAYRAHIPEHAMESRLCRFNPQEHSEEGTGLLIQRVLEIMNMGESHDNEYRLFYIISTLPDDIKDILLRRPCPTDEVELIGRVEDIELLKVSMAMNGREQGKGRKR
ncbi:hypothetical protein H4R33_006770 [Dimargaris cristalligena]|nr:hypothetical protein H4R33_006770 [Dimargaris cristalligena]